MPIIHKSSKPDPILVADQLKLLQFMYQDWGPEAFAKYMIWILNKKEDIKAAKTHSRLIPFCFNRIQQDVETKLAKKNIFLKPRQAGYTTYVLLRRGFIPSLIEPGTNSFLISQSGEKATEHFAMLRRAYKYIGAQDPSHPELNHLSKALTDNLLHTSYSNRKELIFDQLDNRIGVGSAEVLEAGQGSTLHRIMASEVARWPGEPEETLANLKEALVLDGTLDLESTADGAGENYFFQEYFRAKRGESEFTAHFHQWWWDDGYRIELTDKQKEEMLADMTSDEASLRAKFHLELEQIAFRREKKKSLRHNFDEKYPEDELTCFLVSGSSYFDKDILRIRQVELMKEKPYRTFGTSAKIFKKAIPGRLYIIGADPASGKKIGSGTDSSAAVVIDMDSGEEVASYNEQLSPEDFALDLEQLGKHYNNALLAVERGVGADSGGDGGTVLLTLVNQKYPNIYKHKEWWKRDKNTAAQVLIQEGFPMTPRTRPVALNKLRAVVENNPELINSVQFIQQAMMFVRDEKGRPAAAEGSHDDIVLAYAIAHAVRMIMLGYWDPLIARRERYGATPTDEAAPEELDQ